MTAHDSADDPKHADADRDYESVGADIVVSHTRDEMQMRVTALRRHLRSAFAAAPESRKPDESDKADD